MPALLGEKGKPKIKPSRLEPEKKARQEEENLEDHASEKNKDKKKRPGSEKCHKTASLTIHSTKIIQPTQEIPPDSEFKGYQDYTVQELIIRAHNIRYRLAMQENPNGRVPERLLTRASPTPGTLWPDPQKLPSLPISSLPCYPTVAVRTVRGVGDRHLSRTIKPTLGRRQRLLPCRKQRNLADWAEGFKLYQHG